MYKYMYMYGYGYDKLCNKYQSKDCTMTKKNAIRRVEVHECFVIW